MSGMNKGFDVAVIGAGSVGIAVAEALVRARPARSGAAAEGATAVEAAAEGAGVRAPLKVVLIDALTPMSLTSAASGENYRNWWPHEAMVAFMNRSTDLLEAWAAREHNRLSLTRRGYLLATRADDIDTLLAELRATGSAPENRAYVPPDASDNWQDAPAGIDLLSDPDRIRRHFPSLDPAVKHLVHIRRGGEFSAQQLAAMMLEDFRAAGGQLQKARVVEVAKRENGFRLELVDGDGNTESLEAGRMVNAAGPWINDIAAMLGETLPVRNILQQKLAFEDRRGAIPRRLPFTIDLDAQHINWSEEERELLAEVPELAFLAEAMPGSIHCRPDGGPSGRWIRLGWAYNRSPCAAVEAAPELDDHFPEVVLRGASRLHPALAQYEGRLPAARRHYGGYYTLTEENWPLVGPMKTAGAFVAGAFSGFGSMAACAAGELAAQWVRGDPLPPWGKLFSLERYDDSALMASLRDANRGIL
ncbi:MAG: FAD-dependent oxidoreductase [Gammaproteobacteria bacterium]|nr:MAG: FAD-dependent oxidoreductase [Gammaproteobacteria bacterium]